MYRGEVEFSPGNAIDIFHVARVMLLEDLQQLCVSFMSENLDLDNCLHYWHWGITHGVGELAEQSRLYLEKNFDVTYFSNILST